MTIMYRTVSDQQLDDTQHHAIRALLNVAFDHEFSDEDNDHAAGGVRVIAMDGAQIVGHAALVARSITIAGTLHTVGYVEGVAVLPSYQGQGIGAQIIRQITDMAQRDFVVNMLSTGETDFYAKFGWQRFVGQSFVDDHGTIVRTADEDEGLMLLTSLHHLNQLGVAWVCDWRTGDVW
jgi:aminoglycoside 2'-N-acetyltransferase I